MSLSALDVIRVWEAGQEQQPTVQALVILTAALSQWTWDDLARLPLKRRDGLLFALRRELLGARLDSVVECPECRATLEFALDTSEIGVVDDQGGPDPVLSLDASDQRVEYRLPDSTDIAAIFGYADVEQARRALLEHCVLRVTDGAGDVPASALSAGALAALAADFSERDAAAEVEIDLTCPDCGHGWQVALDIASFFWSELSAQARRLLREVDALARAYGWREVDILSMSATRRQAYLDMVLGT
jgi:hypothetical protein